MGAIPRGHYAPPKSEGTTGLQAQIRGTNSKAEENRVGIVAARFEKRKRVTEPST